jgi:S-methylmethionine-dependent homocysteine/selenocysteine methylase
VAGVLQNEINDSLTNKKPNVVESIHRDYLAHCNVITTNSFVAVPQRMIESGLSRSESYPYPQLRAAQLIIAAVCRAKTAITKHNAKLGEDDNDKIKQKKMIAGCIPPLTDTQQTTKHIIPPLWISFTVHDNQPTKLRSDESLVLTCQSIIQEASELNITYYTQGYWY